MQFFFVIIVLAHIEVSYSQWYNTIAVLASNTIFTEQTGPNAYLKSGTFLQQSTQVTANFITCTNPKTSYITLNSNYPTVVTNQTHYINIGDFLAFDLYFQGTWQNQSVKFKIGSFEYQYYYESPSVYSSTNSFCDSLGSVIKTVNFTMTTLSNNKILFFSSNSGDGLVSIKNFYSSTFICFPSCSKCSGPDFQECTICYYQTPTNGICPTCPANEMQTDLPYRFSFFQEWILSNLPKQSHHKYLVQTFTKTYFTLNVSPENMKWSLILDSIHLDTTLLPNIYLNYQYIYGVFKYNSGVYRFINELSINYATHLIGFHITLVTFNAIPLNCGIQFKINNTYYGSIYRNNIGIQTHNVQIYETISSGSYLTYFVTKYLLITYLDIPKNQLLFSAIGNYTDNTAGWGIIQVQVTAGLCPQNCELCEVSFKCKICDSGYYFYKDGTCINSCQQPYQKLNGSYCVDYDQQTPYSQFLIQEYLNLENDPRQYSQYTLISQNGTNFLKGEDIYYSYQQNQRVFGGPLVWAQAKFKRVHNIVDKHHSITIAFFILYGPTFPLDGQFIYTIENNPPVSKSISSYYSSYSDGSKYDRVNQIISHNTSTLTIYWECFGPNNEPIQAYCGFYNYYIAVHKCKPYCLECSDQYKCTQWNSTYDSNVIKFSQEECLINQYYDQDSVRCINCPPSCLTCTSKLDCQSCESTFTLSKLGCICKQNQYEESNQCFDCPIECSQCLSSNYCIECLISNNRQLQNGQCNCIDGYYPILSDPQCLICHKFCKTCIGPTSDECITCKNIDNIENVGSICRCPTGSYYQDSIQTCSYCHSSCQLCFSFGINGCLACDSSLHRILKGLRCDCKSGYYEQNNICTNCPIIEDNLLSQCYNLCNNNQQIWHTLTCNSCDLGFQLLQGECEPICGDLQIKGYEQCEDGNSVIDDLCYNCQYQCPAHCLTCNQNSTLPCPDICGDGYITGSEECEDGNIIQYDGCYNCQYQCQPQCTKCIKGECFECATAGWFIDPTVTPWQCKERCGDLQIIGVEQCEDGNTSDTDGCKDCMYYCRIGCSSCDYTSQTCLSCELPGFVPQSYYCKNICGDGLVVTDPSGIYSEQCDDSNTINYDGCSSSCTFQCQPLAICTSCVNNICEVCAPEYFLSSNKICISVCGDSIIVDGEDCEDSFILPYKGCQNCISKCQSSCVTCDNNGQGCLSCNSGYNIIDKLCYSICGDGIVTDDEQCDDGNIIFEDGCHFCQFSCEDSCLNCISGVCYDCLDGYQLISFKCYPICGDEILGYNEQCEILDSSHSYGCNNCKFKCDKNCQICFFGRCQICQVGYEINPILQTCQKEYQQFDIQIEFCKIQIAYLEQIYQTCTLNLQSKLCTKNCKVCLDQICMECFSGYYGLQCISQFGDGIVVDEEVCYDQNNQRMNDNRECYYNCDVNCMSCVNGKCDLCLQGFYLFNNECISKIIITILYLNDDLDKCGDYKIGITEECEDYNSNPFDGCNQCKFQCDLNCITCQFGKCQGCIDGYIVNTNYMCEPECGDGILIPFTNEQCDNADDGCQNCQFKCQPYCLQCNLQWCFQCQNGFSIYFNQCLPICGDGILKKTLKIVRMKMMNNLMDVLNANFSVNKIVKYANKYLKEDQCQSVCGDKIITDDEQCDDGNETQFDGCYDCQYQCNQHCVFCEIGVCIECTRDYALINGLCILNEQNAIKIIESFDKNDPKSKEAILDGNEICNQFECSFSKQPNMKLTFRQQQFSLQYIDISFDQQIKFRDQIIKQKSSFNISINDLDPKDYNITINPIQDISFDLQYAYYQVIIEIFPQVLNKPIIFILLNQDVVNSNNQPLQFKNQSISLQIPKVISESIKQTSIKAQQSNKAFMIGAICLCIISLISGESSVVVEIFNILQYQSFLRFINVEYPENLFIYFQAQDLLSITSYLQFFQLDDFLNLITRKELENVNVRGKFKVYNIDADLFTNIFPQIIQFLVLITMLHFIKRIQSLLVKLLIYKTAIYHLQTKKSKILISVINLLLYLGKSVKILIRLRYFYNFDQIRELIYLNSWDLIFKVILQLHYNRIDNIRSILTTIIAGIIFLYFIYFLLQSFKQCSDIYNKNIKAKLQIKFITLDMCRTMLFHIVLILFQDQQFLQCLLLSFSSLFQCYLLYQYKQCSKSDRIISILIEATLTVFSLSLFFYLEIEQVQLSYEKKVTLGFIHMNSLILCLAIVLARHLIPKIIKIFKFMCKKEIANFASEVIFI
ncbi:unnamed protein product (macronuclear) [Paramecium tetraurelia]|uniref:EGF-like domain-containing protein n=1 Tax=Paramecium tetraurelia TaxID=5888 RepID=A0EHA1_PARTE|nr:uncharacterized protein GSPATT00027016001 [Paramecium tetraurelia]CAK94692.1 unnamed protein product [Paramecium tetraurelia]|eukprot:XP_001462065.1 hypothetical protein (macronuclear) [Paramecium tetraurelia strain d4-2]